MLVAAGASKHALHGEKITGVDAQARQERASRQRKLSVTHAASRWQTVDSYTSSW